MILTFSIIIPVFNRPDEIDELLQSLCLQTYSDWFEIVIIEDGSSQTCADVVARYRDELTIKYLSKPNTGAGLSRNFGMKNASGNYFIILDSDVLLPPTYLSRVDKRLQEAYTDVFGGPDAAHDSFSDWQKAINYAMTSFLTTGGLRGGKKKKRFQPRSFNMGLSKKAFIDSGGFSSRRIGEDIDLSFRLEKLNFSIQLIPEAFVYHKRRSSFKQFFRQTYNFGKERPILTKQYPDTAKITYWFPTFFTIGLLIAIVTFFLKIYIPILLLLGYLLTIFIDSSIKSKNLKIGLWSVLTTFTQFIGYGTGFLQSILFYKKRPTISP